MNAPWKGPADDLVTNSEMAPMPIRLIFPETVAEFIEFTSTRMAVDPVSIAMPALAAMAATVGRSRKLQLDSNHYESAALWTVLLGYSGSRKSPAIESAVKPLDDENARLMILYEERHKLWEEEVSNLKAGEPKPPEPQRDRLLSNDPTFEAIVDLLADCPRFGLVAKDELESWFTGFTRYTNSSSESGWLSLYNARNLAVDRKTKGPDGKKSRLIQDALISITGAVPPAILAKALSSDRWSSGLGPRLLVAAPPEIETDIWVPYDFEKAPLDGYGFAIKKVLDNLDGSRGVTIRFDRDTHALWNEDSNDRRRRMYGIKDKSSVRRGQLSKLNAISARWALVHWVFTQVMTGKPTYDAMIGLESLSAGIQLADWCERESARVLGILSGAGNEATVASYVSQFRRPEYLQGMTAREFFRLNRSGPNKLADTDHARETLAAMVKMGILVEFRQETTTQGGAPTTKWKLASGQ
jgi:hypothetical protein